MAEWLPVAFFTVVNSVFCFFSPTDFHEDAAEKTWIDTNFKDSILFYLCAVSSKAVDYHDLFIAVHRV